MNKTKIKYDYFEYRITFICPNCQRELSFNEQRQPYECDCGIEYWIDPVLMRSDSLGRCEVDVED